LPIVPLGCVICKTDEADPSNDATDATNKSAIAMEVVVLAVGSRLSVSYSVISGITIDKSPSRTIAAFLLAVTTILDTE
jgi:hypothetical protein